MLPKYLTANQVRSVFAKSRCRMINEFKVGRRYKIRGPFVYLCVAIHNREVVLIPEDTRLHVLTETIHPRLLRNSTELPPEPGEYYEGDDIIIANVLPAKYIRRLAADSHAIHMLDCPRPSIVTNSHISRPVPKPKTIRRPPTDQDAIDQPRRKCWVRSCNEAPWTPATLLCVHPEVLAVPFLAYTKNYAARYYPYCEIEVPNE
jgi:hypothetical protein